MNEQPNPNRPSETGQVILGVLIALGLHLIQVVLMVVGIPTVAFIGVSQLIYLVPAAMIARKRGRTGIMKGIIIGAALTFLLNAACFAYFLSVFSFT